MPKNSHTYIGFDFGTKRIGLAVGQSITKTASPLMTLDVRQGLFWETLNTLLSEWNPNALVVGLAMQPDGSPSKTSELATQFGKHLMKKTKLEVHFVEERLTSVAARRTLATYSGLSKKQDDKDAMAAAIILESWLNQNEQELTNDVSIPLTV